MKKYAMVGIVGVIISIIAVATVLAADTGSLSPTTTGSPSNQWSTPTNAFSSNNAYAVETTDLQKQDYATFGFSIPAGATINGIVVHVEARVRTPGAPLPEQWQSEVNVDLSWNAGTTYTATKNNIWDSGMGEATQFYGGGADTWGRTWSVDDFSDANFRARVTMIKDDGGGIDMDHIRVTVYYTAAGGGGAVEEPRVVHIITAYPMLIPQPTQEVIRGTDLP